MRLNNKLAPKFRSFSTIIPLTSVKALVKNDKSEYCNQISSLILKKTYEVSLNTVLFIEKMNKIEDNKLSLYKAAFSIDNLLVAYGQIKFKLENVTSNQMKKTLKSINLNWFKIASNQLLKGLFIYPKVRRVFISKKMKLPGIFPIKLTSPRIKIIERSLLNILEPVFEGKFN